MAYLRVRIDLAFPMPLNSKVKTCLQALKDEIRQAKKYARKINEGLVNEEMTTIAEWHQCFHDEGKTCGDRHEI